MSRYSKAHLRAGLRKPQEKEPLDISRTEAAHVEDVLLGPPQIGAPPPKPPDSVPWERPVSR